MTDDRVDNFAPFFGKKINIEGRKFFQMISKTETAFEGPEYSADTKIIAEKYPGPQLLAITV